MLSHLLRIGEYEQFVVKTIGNNVYMNVRGKKVVFKRARLPYERNNVFATIKWLAKKYKPDYEGRGIHAFVLSDKYIMVLYVHCLSQRKTVVLENIELERLSETEFSMVKLESVREVLF